MNTLRLAQRWQEAGVPKEQAEKMVTALNEQLGGLPVDFVRLEGKVTLLVWMVGANVALTIAVLTHLFLK